MESEKYFSTVIDGFLLEIRKGKKTTSPPEADIVVFLNGRKISHLLPTLINKIIYMCEERLYPPGEGKGGEYWLDYLKKCFHKENISDVISLKKYKNESIDQNVVDKFNTFCDWYERNFPSKHNRPWRKKELSGTKLNDVGFK